MLILNDIQTIKIFKFDFNQRIGCVNIYSWIVKITMDNQIYIKKHLIPNK